MAVRSAIERLEDSLREEIDAGRIEQTIFEGGTPEGDAQCQHYFGDGVYVRSLWIPAGTVVVGRIHKQARVCMVLAGECSVVDEWQQSRVRAPWIGEFKKGSKTVVYAHSDCLWAACLGTEKRDPRTLFYELTCADHREYQALLETEEKMP